MPFAAFLGVTAYLEQATNAGMRFLDRYGGGLFGRDHEHLCLKARAKINLALDVCRKRPDGYHELKTVMQTVALYDNLYIKKVHKDNYLKLVTNLSFLPNDHKNIVYKAAKALIDHFNIQEGVFIQLQKNIPVSAGLGGGSADCAATLIGMRNLFYLPMSLTDLAEKGRELGADVPFCVMRGTALAEGIGERLTRLSPMPNCYIVLAKPQVIVSTAEVFKSFDFDKVKERPDTDQLIFHIGKGDLKGICRQMKNSLESVTAENYPIIYSLKEALLECGAEGAMMSGSGPTVFGLFSSPGRARSACASIKDKFPDVHDIILTRTFNVKACSR